MSDTPKTDAFEALVNRPTNWWDFARELERENAALREEKERLDWIAKNRSVSVTERPLAVTPDSLRASIDAARKEAQP